jgi:outer membrane receptor protein involved in Fe transport
MAAWGGCNRVLGKSAEAWLVSVSASAIVAFGLSVPAHAQGNNGARQAQRPAASVVAFDIPAQSLDSALSAFGRATGVQLLYDSGITAGLRSAPVQGSFRPSEALARMLASTGLSSRFTGARTATLQRNAGMNSHAQVGGNAMTLDAIVVEGEKMSRDYFRTYSSVGVVTGQQVYEYNVPDLKKSFDMLGNVRSFQANYGNNGFVIRGLNSEGVTSPTNSAPIISVIVDGAIQNGEATRRGARGVWDVEQIEVLRGPQSTLQGQNSLGGAVLVKTKDPTMTPEVIVDGQYGQHDFRSGAFAVSTPVVANQVAIRVAGESSRELKNITYTDPSVARMAQDELDVLRAKLLVTPAALPGLRALFTVSRTDDFPGVNAVTGPDFFARRFSLSASTAGIEFRKTRVDNYISDISYDFLPGWKVQSVTALANTGAQIFTPSGSSFFRDELRDGTDFSQDLRVTFDRPDSPLSGVMGLFYGRFKNETNSLITTTAFGPLLLVQDTVRNNLSTSTAGYADFRYRFFERWTLLAGGRLVRDKVETRTTGRALDDTFTVVPVNEDVSSSNTVFLPKGGLAYDLTPNQTLAATVSRGYRTGFSEVVPGTTTSNTVAPEFLWSYELAYRSKWWDDRLQLNGNIFYYDYKNQQIVVSNPVTPTISSTQNAGKSHVYGAEIEARVRPLEGLTMFASIGLLRTKFDEAVTSTGDYTGKQFPESPTVTASAGGIYKHQSGYFAGADMSYTDGFYSSRDPANDPNRFVSSFLIVNARLGYEAKYGTLMLFARNLFDKQYLTAISVPSGGVYNQATIGEGRVIGVRGTVRFQPQQFGG